MDASQSNLKKQNKNTLKNAYNCITACYSVITCVFTAFKFLNRG